MELKCLTQDVVPASKCPSEEAVLHCPFRSHSALHISVVAHTASGLSDLFVSLSCPSLESQSPHGCVMLSSLPRYCSSCPLSLHVQGHRGLVLAFKEFRVLRVAKCTPPETSKNTKAAAVDVSLAGFCELAVCRPWPFPALPHHGGRGGQERRGVGPGRSGQGGWSHQNI